GGLLELRGAGEEGQGRRHGPGGARRGERDAVDEVVPRDEEGDDRRREHAGGGERDDGLAEGLERGRAVDLGRLLQLPGDLPEEGRQGPDGDRQGEGQVGDDEAGPGVVQADRAPEVEQRRDDRDDGEDRHGQGGGEDDPLAPEVQPRDGVGAQRREEDGDEGGDERDADGVAQRRQEEVLGAAAGREDRLVVLQRPLLGQEGPGEEAG